MKKRGLRETHNNDQNAITELYFQVAIPKMFDKSSEDVESSLVEQQGRAAFREAHGSLKCSKCILQWILASTL